MKRRTFLSAVVGVLGAMHLPVPLSWKSSKTWSLTSTGELMPHGLPDLPVIGTTWVFDKYLTDEEISWLHNHGEGRPQEEVQTHFKSLVHTFTRFDADGACSWEFARPADVSSDGIHHIGRATDFDGTDYLET